MKRKVRNNSNSQSLHSMQVSRSPHYSLAAPNSARSLACSRVKSQNGPKKAKGGPWFVRREGRVSQRTSSVVCMVHFCSQCTVAVV